MPVVKRPDGWYWGDTHGPFDTKQKAVQVGQAAHASGFQESMIDTNCAASFIATMLHSATLAHLQHFQVTGPGSYSAHVALNTYYDEIVDLVDSLTESIQGAYDVIIQPYPSMFAVGDSDPLTYLTDLRDYVRSERKGLPQDSEIQNEVDNIATLLNHTVYKLRFLM
jgi:hypothetical protein